MACSSLEVNNVTKLFFLFIPAAPTNLTRIYPSWLQDGAVNFPRNEIQPPRLISRRSYIRSSLPFVLLRVLSKPTLLVKPQPKLDCRRTSELIPFLFRPSYFLHEIGENVREKEIREDADRGISLFSNPDTDFQSPSLFLSGSFFACSQPLYSFITLARWNFEYKQRRYRPDLFRLSALSDDSPKRYWDCLSLKNKHDQEI